MNTQIRSRSFSLLAAARWLALRLVVPLFSLLLSACGQAGIPGSVAEFNQGALELAGSIWGIVFVLWIVGLIFWLGAYAIQGYWDAPWQKVSGWGKPALIYGAIGQVAMGVLYGLAQANIGGYSGR